MRNMKPADLRGLYEEIANSSSHAVGLGLALAGMPVLLVQAYSHGDKWHVISAIIYGLSIISVFLSSTLYHGFQVQPIKHILRVIDHMTIYGVIAGTLTPFLLVHGRNTWGWSMLAALWVVWLLGILYKLFFFNRSTLESVATYVVMSWLAATAVIPILGEVGTGCTVLLISGLIIYTIGVYFYVKDDVQWYHTIWHGFVVGGATCHYVAISVYVMPMGPSGL